MGLVNTTDLLDHAEKHSYAIGAFNVVNLQFLNGILEAAEAVRSPVILNIAEAHFPYVNIEQITPAIKHMADNACVPVVLNLDHGLSIETIVRTLRCGFSAVMYDASQKSFEQNIEETQLVVKMELMLSRCQSEMSMDFMKVNQSLISISLQNGKNVPASRLFCMAVRVFQTVTLNAL